RKPLIVDEIQFAGSLGPGQVLVRIRFSGICGAQINEIDAVKGPDRFLPHLLGHEGVGEVVEIGPLVKSVSPGDTVVLHWMVGEGVQSDPPTYRWRGESLNAGWVTTLSEYTVASENRVTRISSELAPQYLPLFGCAATTAWGSLVNDVRMRLGESVVVLGAGGVGLLTVEAARAGGAYPIVAVDLHGHRLDSARVLGAQATFASAVPNLESEIRQAVGSRGCDVVVETTGAREMIELAYRLATHGGRVVLVGVPRHDEPVSLDSLPLHFGMAFTGSKGGSVSPDVDIPRLIALSEAGIYRVDSLPITEYALRDVNLGIEAIRSGQSGRTIVNMELSN
ncbi:zinc-binding dehydrogenase, partial [bacterium]|nr:zinc-binding dehydrogenase [bacterium]